MAYAGTQTSIVMRNPQYLMPAEWELHEGTWIAWPHNESHWPGNFQPIPYVYVEIVKALAESEKVFICVNDSSMEASARKILEENSFKKFPGEDFQLQNESINNRQNLWKNIHFFHIPTDASWSRDHGPIFVRDENGKLIITDWIFNAWGKKYPPWDQDDAVPQKIAEFLKIPLVQPGIVLEGGSIDVNGKGTLITTEQCLLNKNRNPHLTREKIEEYLKKYLGATNILWLKEGIVGDDTDGHVDDIARFVDEKTVLCALEENPKDENYRPLKENYEKLQTMHDQDGNPLQIKMLPMPDPVIYKGERLPASYANFYIGNTVVLLPTFRCQKKDQEAAEILQKIFPTRKIIPIDCTDLIWGLGTFHCSTQQQIATHGANEVSGVCFKIKEGSY